MLLQREYELSVQLAQTAQRVKELRLRAARENWDATSESTSSEEQNPAALAEELETQMPALQVGRCL